MKISSRARHNLRVGLALVFHAFAGTGWAMMFVAWVIIVGPHYQHNEIINNITPEMIANLRSGLGVLNDEKLLLAASVWPIISGMGFWVAAFWEEGWPLRGEDGEEEKEPVGVTMGVTQSDHR